MSTVADQIEQQLSGLELNALVNEVGKAIEAARQSMTDRPDAERAADQAGVALTEMTKDLLNMAHPDSAPSSQNPRHMTGPTSSPAATTGGSLAHVSLGGAAIAASPLSPVAVPVAASTTRIWPLVAVVVMAVLVVVVIL